MNTDMLPSAAEDRPAAADWNPRLSAVEIVPLGSLLPGESPRAAGENAEHAKLLANTESVLPPITVHRATRRVIDGRHRLAAAVVRGDDVIRVRFFDGDERDAFVLSVRENTAHGLPLSSRDRAAAADRILRTHPDWSDRAIAGIAGLSAKTVAGLRRALAGNDQPAARLGRDGKVRPLSTAAGRAHARRLLEEMPGASLRSIAELAGISPGTVRDVRNRMLRGEDPVPGSLRAAPPRATGPAGGFAGDGGRACAAVGGAGSGAAAVAADGERGCACGGAGAGAAVDGARGAGGSAGSGRAGVTGDSGRAGTAKGGAGSGGPGPAADGGRPCVAEDTAGSGAVGVAADGGRGCDGGGAAASGAAAAAAGGGRAWSEAGSEGPGAAAGARVRVAGDVQASGQAGAATDPAEAVRRDAVASAAAEIAVIAGNLERGARRRAVDTARNPVVPAARRGDPVVSALDALMNDPSLKFSEQGRFLLRLLSVNAQAVRHRVELTEVIPAHCVPIVGEVARAYAQAWLRVAEDLERKRVAGPSA